MVSFSNDLICFVACVTPRNASGAQGSLGETGEDFLAQELSTNAPKVWPKFYGSVEHQFHSLE